MEVLTLSRSSTWSRKSGNINSLQNVFAQKSRSRSADVSLPLSLSSLFPLRVRKGKKYGNWTGGGIRRRNDVGRFFLPDVLFWETGFMGRE